MWRFQWESPKGTQPYKKQKNAHTNNRHFPRKLWNQMGDALQKCTPPQQTQPQTHTKTIIQSVLWRNRSGKMCMQQPGCGFLTNGVGLVGQPTPMCEIMWNSKEIIGNQWNSSEKTAHTNNRQFPTKPFQNNGGCTAQMPPHHSKNNHTHTHTHQDTSPKAIFAKTQGDKSVAPTPTKATKHHVKNSFSKTIWARQL